MVGTKAENQAQDETCDECRREYPVANRVEMVQGSRARYASECQSCTTKQPRIKATFETARSVRIDLEPG